MSLLSNVLSAKANGKAVSVAVDGKIVQHLTPLEADTLAADALRFASQLTAAAAQARDPRVRRESLKPGEFYKYLTITKYAHQNLAKRDGEFISIDSHFNLQKTSQDGSALVYRCKDFGGELL